MAMAKVIPWQCPSSRLLCLLRARLAALGSSVLPERPWAPSHCPMLELPASKAAHSIACDHSGEARHPQVGALLLSVRAGVQG